MWAAIGALLGIIATLVAYWVQNAPARKRKRLLEEIRRLEDELAKALANGDADTVARCNERLLALYEESGISAKR